MLDLLLGDDFQIDDGEGRKSIFDMIGEGINNLLNGGASAAASGSSSADSLICTRLAAAP